MAQTLLIIFYNSYRAEQLSTFFTLQKLLENFNDYHKLIIEMIIKMIIVFGGDFNLILDCKFDASEGNPILKKFSSKTN